MSGRSLDRAGGKIRVVSRKRSRTQRQLKGVVKWFDADEGWGAITSHERPGECFVSFSNIRTDGFRALRAGQRVEFTYEEAGSILQDGCPLRALAVRPLPAGR